MPEKDALNAKYRSNKAKGSKRHPEISTVSFSGKRIGITGSPGTGKKSVGRDLAKLLGLEYFPINAYAISSKYGSWRSKEFDVDARKLRGKIRTENRVVVGHLLPYVVPDKDLDFVFVLRCSPEVLRKRYLKRGYDERKIRENLQAEVLGVVSEKSSEVYDSAKLAEVDTSDSPRPKSAAHAILDIIIGKERKSFGVIDWLSYAKTPSLLESLLQGKYHILNKTKKDN